MNAAIFFYSFVAPIGAEARIDVPSGPRSLWVAVGDFNRDGFLDLAVAKDTASGPGGITVLLGNGDGTFRPGVNYEAGGSFYSVAVADFNGDGILDLAAGNAATNKVEVLIGNGDGTFQPARNFDVGVHPRFVATGDLRGARIPDLQVANEGTGSSDPGSITIMYNNGDGFFLGKTTIAAGNNPIAIAAADFNGDGRADLAIANYASAVGETASSMSLILSNPNGLDFARNFAANNPSSIISADFNGDNIADLAVVNSGGISFHSVVSVLLGNGDGSFQAPRDLDVSPLRTVVVAGDFNGDGDLDLAVPGRVFLGNGDGTFGVPLDFQTEFNGHEGSIAVGDFNGDGVPDLVLTSGDHVTIYFGKGDGTFQ